MFKKKKRERAEYSGATGKNSVSDAAKSMGMKIVEAQNLRIVYAGKDLKDHLDQPACNGQGYLPLDQVA